VVEEIAEDAEKEEGTVRGNPLFANVIPAKAVPRNAGQELPAFAGTIWNPDRVRDDRLKVLNDWRNRDRGRILRNAE
jgi:hypothetical protein